MKLYTEKRPWGFFREFMENKKATVKILVINPRQQLSLQYHFHRKEFWRVLSGKPIIQIGNKKIKAKKGDEFTIPLKTKHSIASKNGKVEILEISTGAFDENDIVRLKDKYGRVSKPAKS